MDPPPRRAGHRHARAPVARLDRSAAAPLHVQLYESLRGLILTGQLEIGARLPSTRELACELGISRSTVVTAYERLGSEGYIEGRLGAGSAVSTALPDPPATAGAPADPLAGPVRQLSARGALIASMPASDESGLSGRAFTTGTPALDRFPWDIWSRLVAHVARHLPPETHGYQDPAGHAPLRQAIAAYVGVRRGIPCTAAQVIVVSGAQEAIALAAHVLLDPGDQVWVEEPGYPGARAALQAAGAELVPVPVDLQGLRIAAGHALCPYPRLVFVTPATSFRSA